MSSGAAAVGGRREAREEALALLYEVELTGAAPLDALAARPVPLAAYATEIVTGVAEDGAEIDGLLSSHLKGWRLERLAIVDRTIARMASWELLRRADVPTGVVLSEAVELATQYSGDEAPRFLNGVLRAIADDVRPDEPGDDPAR